MEVGKAQLISRTPIAYASPQIRAKDAVPRAETVQVSPSLSESAASVEVDPSTQSLAASADGVIQSLSADVVDRTHENEITLSKTSPEILTHYLSALSSLAGDPGRAGTFITGVSEILSKREHDASASLQIGNSVAQSLPAQIEAAYAASINGSVAVFEDTNETEKSLTVSALDSLGGKTSNLLDFADSGGNNVVDTRRPAAYPPLSSSTGNHGLEKVGFPDVHLFDRNDDGQFDAQDLVANDGDLQESLKAREKYRSGTAPEQSGKRLSFDA